MIVQSLRCLQNTDDRNRTHCNQVLRYQWEGYHCVSEVNKWCLCSLSDRGAGGGGDTSFMQGHRHYALALSLLILMHKSELPPP